MKGLTFGRNACVRSAVVLVLVAFGVLPLSASGDKPAPEVKPVVLPSRSLVEMMYWVGEGKTLVFGGHVKPDEPDRCAEARLFDQDRTIRLPAIGESSAFAASPDGATLICVERIGIDVTSVEFRFIDVRKREKTKTLTIEVKDRLFAGRAMALSPDGTMLACGGFSATPTIKKNSENIQSRILLLDLRTGRVHADLVQKDDVINAVAFSPDGKLLVTGHGVIDKAKPGVKVWDVEKATLVREWPAKRQQVTGVAVSPDGKYVASVGYSSKLPTDRDDFKGWDWDQLVSVHDIGTGELVRNLKGHDQSPCCVAFSPNGKLLASGGPDKTVRIWNVGSGANARTFIGHTSQVGALAFAPDGKQLASGGLDKSVYIWDMTPVKKSDR